MLLAQSRSRLLVARQIIPLRTLKDGRHQYSSLRRPRGGSQGPRNGRIAARTSAPSRAKGLGGSASEASPIAGATTSALNNGSLNPNVAATPQEQAPSNVIQGLDIAATPAVVPEDPFGVLQFHDTASKLLSQPALIMTRQIEMLNGKRSTKRKHAHQCSFSTLRSSA